MNNLRLLILTTLCLLLTTPALAQVKAKAAELVEDYLDAHKRKDEPRQIAIWNQIKKDREILNYIQENHRHEYTLFKYRQIQDRINGIKNQYEYNRVEQRENTRRRRSRRTSTARRASTESGSGSRNARRVTNSNRSPNRVTRSNSNSNIKRTNSDTVKAFSNQSRVRAQSNQSRLQTGR